VNRARFQAVLRPIEGGTYVDIPPEVVEAFRATGRTSVVGTIDGRLRRALKQDPSFALTYYAFGKLFLQQRDYLSAERSLAKALQLDPHMQEAWYAYGREIRAWCTTHSLQTLGTCLEREMAKQGVSPAFFEKLYKSAPQWTTLRTW
jgi:tetratricopeptide (TPR) repeat protein